VYHSQNSQDRQINEKLFQNQRGGVFVEFGAHDGIYCSNSLFFERELGWTGLLVEANPTLFDQLARNRPGAKCLNAAIFDYDGTVAFEQIDGGAAGWGGISETLEAENRKKIEEHRRKINKPLDKYKRTITVPCLTLDSALSMAGITHVDYMSIDVEGAEYKILSVFPFEKYTINVIGIEDNFGSQPIEPLLTAGGFRKVARIGADNIYLNNRWFGG
jgi:FkbM family methyltransferase